jgi:hypothetical protein
MPNQKKLQSILEWMMKLHLIHYFYIMGVVVVGTEVASSLKLVIVKKAIKQSLNIEIVDVAVVVVEVLIVVVVVVVVDDDDGGSVVVVE